MVQLLAFYRGKTLETFLNRFPTKEFADDNEYTWDEEYVLLLSD